MKIVAGALMVLFLTGCGTDLSENQSGTYAEEPIENLSDADDTIPHSIEMTLDLPDEDQHQYGPNSSLSAHDYTRSTDVRYQSEEPFISTEEIDLFSVFMSDTVWSSEKILAYQIINPTDMTIQRLAFSLVQKLEDGEWIDYFEDSFSLNSEHSHDTSLIKPGTDGWIYTSFPIEDNQEMHEDGDYRLIQVFSIRKGESLTTYQITFPFSIEENEDPDFIPNPPFIEIVEEIGTVDRYQESIRVEIYNHLIYELMTGEDYRIEYFDGNKWIENTAGDESGPVAFAEVGLIIPENSTYSFGADLRPGEQGRTPGRYRLIKEFGLFRLAIEFDIE